MATHAPTVDDAHLLCSLARHPAARAPGHTRLRGVAAPSISDEEFYASITNEYDRAALKASVEGRGHGRTRLVEVHEQDIHPDREAVALLQRRLVLLPNPASTTLICDRLGCSLDKKKPVKTSMFSCGIWTNNTPNIEGKESPDIFKTCRGAMQVKQDKNCPICDVCKHFQMGEFRTRDTHEDQDERGILRYKSGPTQYKLHYIPTIELENIVIDRGDPYCLNKMPSYKNLPRMAHMCGYCKNNCKPSDMQRWRYDGCTRRESPVPTLPSNINNAMLTLSLNWLGKKNNLKEYIQSSDLSVFIAINHRVVQNAMRGDTVAESKLMPVKGINNMKENMIFLFDFIRANSDIFWFIMQQDIPYEPPTFTGTRKQLIAKPRKNKLPPLQPSYGDPTSTAPKKKKQKSSTITYNDNNNTWTPMPPVQQAHAPPPPTQYQLPPPTQYQLPPPTELSPELCQDMDSTSKKNIYMIQVGVHSSQSRVSFSIVTNPQEASNANTLKQFVAQAESI